MIPNADESEIQDRLDLTIMRAYSTSESPRATRTRLLHRWREDELLSRLVLSRIEGLSAIAPEEDERGVRNLADYWFEPLVMPTMSLGQARDYFLSVKKSLRFELGEISPPTDRPLILESVHHCCVFSVLYATIQLLVAGHGFRKAILLHLRDPLDPRAATGQILVERVLQVETVCLRLEGAWLATLGREMSDRTVLIYFGDMPPSLFPDRYQPGKTSSRVHFYARPDVAVDVEGISIARFLARRHRAGHHLLDYPEPGTVRLRPWRRGAELHCPLADWVFWPALRRWYGEYSVPSWVKNGG